MLSWGAAQWAAFGACAAVVVYLLLGLLAWVQIREFRRDRELQTRPYVVVDFEFRRYLIYIAISNIGRSPARDVVVTFDKPLQTSDATRADLAKAAALTSPIPMLAPGRKITLLFDSAFYFFGDDSLPRRYEARVCYHDHALKKSYDDPPYVLDLTPYEGTEIEPPGVEELVAEVKAIGKTLGMWTDGHQGLLANVVDREAKQKRDRRVSARRRSVRLWRQEGSKAYLRYRWNTAVRRFRARWF